MGEIHTPNITLYTSYFCPWAHRAQIALKELGLPFETVHIDLSVPRTEEYLKINPRGLVPSINYDGEIITESGVISHFLTDIHPSHLVKTSTEKGGALQRARIEFFVDTFFSKVQNQFFPLLSAEGSDLEAKADGFVNSVVKELEPLLRDAKPFFGGNERLGLAEVQTGSFLLRILSFPKYDIIPQSILPQLESKAPAFWKWANAVVKEESVTYIWNEELVAQKTKERVAKNKAAAAAK